MWKRTASLPTAVHSQARPDWPSPRSACTRHVVSSAWRNAAASWCARIAPATGSNSGTKRGTLSASVPDETGSPWSPSQAPTR